MSKEKLLKLGRFLRVIDEQRSMISLTNTAMWVIIGKLVIAPQFTVEELGAFFVALLAYSGKKLLNNKQQTEDTVLEKELTTVKRDINILNDKLKDAVDKAGAAAMAAGLSGKKNV